MSKACKQSRNGRNKFYKGVFFTQDKSAPFSKQYIIIITISSIIVKKNEFFMTFLLMIGNVFADLKSVNEKTAD